MHAAPAPLYRLLALGPGAADTADGSWLLVAGAGYVLRSPDGGEHFTGGRLSLDTTASAAARINQLVAVNLSEGEHLLFAATSRGLYISADGGASWSLSGHGLPATDVRTIEMRPDGIYALAATIGQDFRSQDAGATWLPVALPAVTESLARTAPSLLYSLPTGPAVVATATSNPGASPLRNRNRPK